MLSEAMNLCGTCRCGCKAGHSHAAVGKDPSGNPGTMSVGVRALSMQKLAGLGLGEPCGEPLGEPRSCKFYTHLFSL